MTKVRRSALVGAGDSPDEMRPVRAGPAFGQPDHAPPGQRLAGHEHIAAAPPPIFVH